MGGASVASCTRTRTLQYNMVAQTTLVVFTIVLAATGVFVPETGRELEENDALISVQNVADVQESGHFVKRDALKDDTAGKGKGKKKRPKKNKATNRKKKRSKKGNKTVSKNRKRNQRKERGVKRKNLGRVRGSKVNGNPKHVKLTK